MKLFGRSNIVVMNKGIHHTASAFAANLKSCFCAISNFPLIILPFICSSSSILHLRYCSFSVIFFTRMMKIDDMAEIAILKLPYPNVVIFNSCFKASLVVSKVKRNLQVILLLILQQSFNEQSNVMNCNKDSFIIQFVFVHVLQIMHIHNIRKQFLLFAFGFLRKRETENNKNY